MNETLKQAFDFQTQGNFREAERIYNQILKERPDDIQVLNLLARIKLDEKNFNESLAINNKILKLDKNNENALFESAIALKNLGDLEQAIKLYSRVIKLNPKNIKAYYNLGAIYADFGDVEKSIYNFNKVLESNPDDVDTRYFIALSYFKNKQYKNGLPYFESRLCRKSSFMTQLHTYPNLMKNAQLWQGQNVPNKTVYTYYEAGFGDVLMYSRYLSLLQERCERIIFKPQQPLAELFKENFPNIYVMEYFEPEKKIHFDYHIPLMSLPLALGLDDKTIFTSNKIYLKANQEKVKSYHERFFDNKCFKIGIKWQGNITYDLERVIDVSQFIRLFQIPNTKFYSFQTFDGSERIEELRKHYDIVDIGKTLTNFSDTAGAIENLDLVISNDTSLVHIAGAMGKPCWVLLPYLYNWRWHQDLSKCDWYDTVQPFRQPTPGDWTSVFDILYGQLNKITGI